MLVMIDNYDSFVYNLAAYFEELNQDIKVIRNDKLTIEELESIENLDGVLSRRDQVVHRMAESL